MWTVVESISDAGDGSDHRNEDHVNAAGRLAWVLDGASGVSHDRADPRTDRAPTAARWLVDQLDAQLAVQSAEPAGLEKIVALAIQSVAREKARPWSPGDIPPSAALGVVRRVGNRCEFLVLADVSVILSTDAGIFEFTDKRVDKGNAAAHARMVDLLTREKWPGAAAREAIRPMLAEHRRTNMNQESEHGYWVASLDERAVDHALTGTLDGVNEAILATDGFMRIIRPFKCIDHVEQLFDGRTLADVRDEVRAVEREDLETSTYPRWRVRDDICAQRLRWVG